MKDIWLSNYCRWNDTQEVIKRLEDKNDIDLTYNDGVYFKFAIGHKNSIMLDELLKYYKKTQLTRDQNSIEYKNALFNLKTILEDVEHTYDFSEEIKQILGKYLSLSDEEDENDQDLSGFDIEEGYDAQDGSHYTIHKSNSAPELLTHQTLTTSLLHSSSESLVSSAGYEIHNQDSTKLVGQEFQNIHFE